MREPEPPRRMELSDYEELTSGPTQRIEDLPTPHVPAINWGPLIGFLIPLGIIYLFRVWQLGGFD